MQKILLTLGAVLFSVSASFAALTQDANDCYLIGTVDELYEFADSANEDESFQSACVKLTQNIEINKNVVDEYGYLKKGTFREWNAFPFYGTFDGNNHSISGVYYEDGESYYVGFFRYLGNKNFTTEIKNLEIKDSYFQGKENVGTFASRVRKDSKVNLKNCRSAGVVVGENNMGGFFGVTGGNSEVKIQSSENASKVKGKNFVGGFVGKTDKVVSGSDDSVIYSKLNIESSTNKGNVTAEFEGAGGFVGIGGGNILTSLNEGYILANYGAGGFFGTVVDTAIVKNCFNKGYIRVDADEDKYNDVLGENAHDDVYAVGGFVGYLEGEAFIENSLNIGLPISHRWLQYGSDFVGAPREKDVHISSSFYLSNDESAFYSNAKKSYQGAISVTTEQLNNGAVATALHSVSAEWGQQNIGEDCYPDFSGNVNAEFKFRTVKLVTYEGDTNATNYPTEYQEGFGCTIPAYVERDGYVFVGWFPSENPVDGESSVSVITEMDTGDKVLYARFIQIKVPESDGECYLISSTEELYGFAAIVNGAAGLERNGYACGKLTQNIVVNEGILNEKGEYSGKDFQLWYPIGSYQYPFKGSFDGNGFSISGLFANFSDQISIGFIGATDDDGPVLIKNLQILDSYFYGDAYVGAFIGFDDASETKIENCFTNSFVKGGEYVGGLVGISYGELDILKGYNTGFVSGIEIVGGLVANGGILEIEDSYNEGPVFGGTVGGFVGEADYSGYVYVANSYNAGNLSGGIVGGFVGYADERPDIEIVNCYNLGDIPDAEYSGAFVGSTYGNIEGFISNCFTVTQGHLLGEKMSGKYGYGIHFENVYYIAKDGVAAIVSGDKEDMEGLYAMKEADFYNGTVAKKLFDWIELDDKGIPVEDGADGGVWVVNSPDEKVLPQLDVNSKMRAVFLIAGENGKIADGKNVTMYEMGKSTPLPGAADVTRTGYTFAGWSVEKKGSRRIYAVPETQTGTAIFYAQWKPKKYAVTVSVNDEDAGYVDGVNWSGNGDYEYDSEITLVALAEDGYHFTNWEDDVDAPMRRTIVVKETNVYKANFEKDVSSSSEQTPVPVAKSSSSSVVKSSSSSAMSSSSAKASSSSAKPSSSAGTTSSSSVKSSSSSAGKGGKSSSSSKKSEAVVANASVPHFSVSVTGRRLQVAGAKAGAVYALCDFHGRILQQGVVYSANFNLEARTAGSFILRIGNEIRQVNVR